MLLMMTSSGRQVYDVSGLYEAPPAASGVNAVIGTGISCPRFTVSSVPSCPRRLRLGDESRVGVPAHHRAEEAVELEEGSWEARRRGMRGRAGFDERSRERPRTRIVPWWSHSGEG